MFTGVAQHFRSRISYVEVPAQTVHEQDAFIRVSGMTMGNDYGFSHGAQQGFWPGERAYPQVRIDFTRLRQGNDESSPLLCSSGADNLVEGNRLPRHPDQHNVYAAAVQH